MNLDMNGLLSAILGGAQNSNARLDQLGGELAEGTDQMSALMQESLNTGNQMVQQVGNLATQKAEIDYAQAKSREDMQVTLNLQREDANNEFVRSAAELTAAQRAKAQVLPKLRAATEVSFIDNPIGFIIGQLEAPALAAKYNNLEEIEQNAAKNIQTRTQMLNQMNASTVAATADASKQLAMDSARFLQTEAAQKVRAEQIRYISQIGEQKMRAVTTADKQWDNIQRVFNTQMSMAQFQATQAERAEIRAMRIEEMQTRLADKKTKEEAKHKLDGDIAAVSELLGQVNPDGTPKINSVETLQTVIRDNKKRDQWGMAAMTGTLGDTFGESLDMFSNNAGRGYLQANRPNLLLAADGLKQGVISTANSLNRFDPKTGKAPDQKAVAKEAPNAYQAMVVSSAALSKEGGRTLTDAQFDFVFNPYRAPHAIMLASINSGNMKLGTNVFADAVKTLAATKNNGGNFKGQDEQEAFKVVGELVKARKVTPRDAAAQISRYYKIATQVADDAYGTSTIFQLPKQTTYAAAVEIPAKGFGTTALKVDLMNPASVEKALMQYTVGRLDYLPKAGDIFGVGPTSGQVGQ